MRLAARHGAVAVNPTREVARIDSKPKRKPRALTSDRRGEWLSALAADEKAQRWDLVDLTLVMLATGCRIGECLAIGWSDVDLDAGQIAIEWRLIRVTGEGLRRVPSTKTGVKGERLLALPSWAVAVLKRRRRRALIGSEVEAVFPDSLGSWRDPSNVRKVWRQVAAKAGITDLVTHTLRKTVATFLDDNGIPARQISDQLGHARVSMTQDVYLGRGLADRQAADVLELMFGDDDGGQSKTPDKAADE
jgi:integrase